MRASVADLQDILRNAGLRATAPRIAVLKQLQGASAPVTHAEVAASLAASGFDRATVYRNLIDLTEVGLVRRSDLGDHAWRFELSRRDGSEHDALHPHFICSECGVVSCLPESAVSLRAPRGGPKALRSKELSVQLRGRCDTCQ